MYPDALFPLLDVPALRAVFGTQVRIYPFGEAPPNASTPYAVHHLVSGVPDNCLDDPPAFDGERIQFDVWDENIERLSLAVIALRTQLQEYGYVNDFGVLGTDGRDQETKRNGRYIDWSRLEPWA